MDFALVFEQTQCDAVDWRIAPALVEEATCPIEMVEVVLVRFTTPEFHVCYLKVTPEVTGREALGLLVCVGSADVVGNPLDGVVVMEVIRMVREELDRLGPQRRQGLGVIVETDCEAVGLVVIVHVAEDVVVDVAEEVHVGLHAPVVPCVFEGWVLVEEAAVPATHLVV